MNGLTVRFKHDFQTSELLRTRADGSRVFRTIPQGSVAQIAAVPLINNDFRTVPSVAFVARVEMPDGYSCTFASFEGFSEAFELKGAIP